MTDFAHLHLHTEFSLLDGMGRISDYIGRAQDLGMKHMAVTDHGVMYAALDWYNAAKSAGIHPVIGMEAYLAEGPIEKRDRKMYHQLLLARNDVGYRNLLQLASKAALQGFYYRPRIDMRLLAEHSEGLIATSTCLGGAIPNNFLHGHDDAARQYARDLVEIFGRDNFYIELQDHGLREQRDVNRKLVPLAKDLGLELVATNDVHYCSQEDASAQDILVCVQTNTNIHDPKRMKQETDQFFLKSGDDMLGLFPELPHAVTNTVRLAERCELDLSFKGYQLPEFDVPDGHTTSSFLKALCEQGARRHYGEVTEPIQQRLDYELSVIEDMGFNNYFLIVWDFVRFAKNRNILVGPGRGSAAGSLVTYCLDITGLDPLKYQLIFERFLNPSRIEMPDIDIDFADDRRSEVIDYVVKKYGDDRVAQIVTFGTLKAKAAVRDCGRAMGLSFGDTDRVARLIPTDPKMSIDKALAQVPELVKLYESDDQVRELVETARKVEGLARHSSTHAAGVVIARDPLVNNVPLQRAGGKAEGDITTQYGQKHLEKLGLLKMDFLGLKTLTVLGKAVDLVNAGGGDISLESIPLEDEAAFALLRRGETVGVFQLEGGMTTRMTVDVQPESFEDLIALMALIRPGPMDLAPDYIARKHGKVEVEYPHQLMEQVLKETYGVAIYQDQVMQSANVLAGFSMSEADFLRKAMGKKLPEEMAKWRVRFLEGAAEKSISAQRAGEIFDTIEKFAGYGFNKAHSAAYAVVAAQTAYLKAHYPVEFMAALMSTEMGNTEKTVFNVAECRRAGIQVLPPSVNKSGVEFSVEQQEDGQKAVRFGLGAVKNVGVGAVAEIVAAREASESGELSTLDAFADAVDWASTNKRMVESLVKAGALDEFGERAAVLSALESAAGAAQKRQRAAARGQMDMFGMMTQPDASASGSTSLPDTPPADSRQILEWEKEFLGLYLSSHPLTAITGRGVPTGYHQIADVADRPLSQTVQVIAMIRSIRRITTKTNKTMAVIEVEDLTGTIELVAFPDTYDRVSGTIDADAIRVFSGRVDERGDSRQIILESVTEKLPNAVTLPTVADVVCIQLSFTGEYWQDVQTLQEIDRALNANGDGECDVHFLIDRAGEQIRVSSRSRHIRWDDDLQRQLESIVGPSNAWRERPAAQRATNAYDDADAREIESIQVPAD